MQRSNSNHISGSKAPGRAMSRLGASARSIALVGVCLAALPAAALAAKPQTRNYTVTVKRLALAHGNTVKVKAVIASPEAKVKDWWSQKAVAAVVRKGVNGGYQSPYSSEGYRCTPSVRGERTSFKCTLRGADVPTIVNLNFTVVYRGATRSG